MDFMGNNHNVSSLYSGCIHKYMDLAHSGNVTRHIPSKHVHLASQRLNTPLRIITPWPLSSAPNKSCFCLWENNRQETLRTLASSYFISVLLIITMTCTFHLSTDSRIPARLEAWFSWWVKLSLSAHLLNYSASNLPIYSVFVYVLCLCLSLFISLSFPAWNEC